MTHVEHQDKYTYIYMYIRTWEWEELLELDGVEIFAPLRSLNMSKCGQTRCCWLFFYVFDIIVWINMHLLYVVVSNCIHTSILRSYDDDCASLKACQKLLQDGSGIHHSAVMFLYGYVSYKLCIIIWNVCHQIMQLGPYHTLKLHIYGCALHVPGPPPPPPPWYGPPRTPQYWQQQ